MNTIAGFLDFGIEDFVIFRLGMYGTFISQVEDSSHIGHCSQGIGYSYGQAYIAGPSLLMHVWKCVRSDVCRDVLYCCSC